MIDKNTSFNDFFGITDDDDEDYGLNEISNNQLNQHTVKNNNKNTSKNKVNNNANNKSNINKVQQNNKNVNAPVTPQQTYVKPKKKHKVLKIILLIVVLAIAIMGILGKLGEMGIIGKAGIVANGETEIYGLTLDELSTKEFSVQNKTKKDASIYTNWTFNGELISEGTNTCTVPLDKWSFGDNILEATNNEDVCTYFINVEKSSDGTNSYHNFMSTLNEYPSQLFNNYTTFTKLSSDELAKNYIGEILANGKYKNEQKLNNIKLTVEELVPYSLFLCEPMSLTNNQKGIYSFYIDGNMSNVATATVTVKLDEGYNDNFKIYTFENGKLSLLNSDLYKYYNGTYIITIKKTGNYVLDNSTKSTDTNAAYNIAIIECDDTDQFTYLETAKNLEITAESEKSQSKCNESLYTNFVNALIKDAKASGDVNVNAFTWNNFTVNQIYENSEAVDNYYNYETSTINNAFKDMLDIEDSSYSNNIIAVYYVKDGSGDISTKIAKSLKELGEIGVNVTAIIVNSTVDGIKSLENISDYVEVIEFNASSELIKDGNLDFLNSYIGTINKNMHTYLPQTVEINGEEKNLQLLADSKIDYSLFNKCLCGYNEDLGIGNSYGYVLLEKLAQSNVMMSTWLQSTHPLKSDYIKSETMTNKGIISMILDNDKNNAVLEDRSKLDFETMNYVGGILTYSRFNSEAYSTNNLQSLLGKGSINNVILSLCDKVVNNGLIAEIANGNEYLDILITGIYKDLDAFNTYYLEVYNPAVSCDKQYIKLELAYGTVEGIDNSMGYTYNIEYETEYMSFDRLYIVEDIQIYKDNERVF